MDDRHYADLIRSYDVVTLRQARGNLDVDAWPARARLLDEEIERRLKGVEPVPLPAPPPLAISRREGYAAFLFRFPALVIDLLLVYVPFGMLFEALVGMGQLWPICALPAMYPLYVIVCTRLWGQTAGKWLTGIFVIGDDGSRPTLLQCIRRHVPDIGFAVAMSALLLVHLTAGFSLPEHATASARISSFHFQLPLWDTLDDLWDAWIWSEMLFLSLDARRRSLHEFFSHTLVVYREAAAQLDLEAQFEPSWYEWLDALLHRIGHPLRH